MQGASIAASAISVLIAMVSLTFSSCTFFLTSGVESELREFRRARVGISDIKIGTLYEEVGDPRHVIFYKLHNFGQSPAKKVKVNLDAIFVDARKIISLYPNENVINTIFPNNGEEYPLELPKNLEREIVFSAQIDYCDEILLKPFRERVFFSYYSNPNKVLALSSSTQTIVNEILKKSTTTNSGILNESYCH